MTKKLLVAMLALGMSGGMALAQVPGSVGAAANKAEVKTADTAHKAADAAKKAEAKAADAKDKAEGHKADATKKAEAKATDAKTKATAAAKKIKSQKLTGEVLDLNCYSDHKAAGEAHASCAASCISAGAPIGLLANKKVYVLVNGDHSLKLAEALGPSAGKTVTLSGHQVLLPGGTRTFDVESVEAPAAAAPAKL